MRRFHRTLAASVAAAAMLLSTAVPALAERAPDTAIPASSTCKSKDAVGTYFSPGGRANIRLSPELLRLLGEFNPEFSSIAPVTVTPDFSDISMPIGSTYDKLGAFGEIFYPGGFAMKEPKSGHTVTIDCFWLKTFPSALYTSTSIDGGPPKVLKFATFKIIDGIKGIRPAITKDGQITVGWVPFTLTQEMADLINTYIGTKLKGGMLLGWLEGRFNFTDTQALTKAMLGLVNDPIQVFTLMQAAPGLAAIVAGLGAGLATGGLPSDSSVGGVPLPAKMATP